ncbi:MAG TPA: class I SAM-dependent methyltransferase [Gaiellaceae bacterium]|nr:class I SAM-dependent methyltransferase [Gaiellaceae bacterium]
MSDSRTRIVEQGYDEIADSFVEWRDRIADDPRLWWMNQLTSRLEVGARVLELGCGAGIPDTRLLAERFRVTAVDISREQVRRARAKVPSAEFIQADFTSLELRAASFEAVAAFCSFNHVPRDLLAVLFDRIQSWLVPDGLFLTALGTSDTESWVGDWLGTTMYFSSYPPETNRRLLGDAGFELLLDELVTTREPEPDGEATWQWVLARR